MLKNKSAVETPAYGLNTPDGIETIALRLLFSTINSLICDPTCATGNFLVEAYEHIINKYSKDGYKGFKRHTT